MKMTGVQPHRRTGMLWLRLRTPAHLIKCRERLEALGVLDFHVEHHRSLGTRDRRKAEAAYAERRTEIQQIWKRWESLLETGPQQLSYKNVTALAGEQARAFFEAHEENPFAAPLGFSVPDLPFRESAVKEALDRLDSETRREYAADMAQILELPEEQLVQKIWLSLQKYPFQKALLGRFLVEALETASGAEADSILKSRELYIDRFTRPLLNLELWRFMGVAKRALEARMAGDWRPVEEFDHVPKFEPSLPATRSQLSKALTFAAVIDEKERLSDQRLENQRKAPSTFRSYRKDVRFFCKWRGDGAVTSVTRQEFVRWRDEMIDAIKKGAISSKTVRNRLGSVSAVISWAIEQNKDARQNDANCAEIFPEGHPVREVDWPEWIKKQSEDMTYPLPLAAKILEKARKETHPEIRWIPWLEAHTGMRIGEAEQLEKRDLMEYGGCPYLLIRSDETRRTKTNKSRRVPLHKAVIAEGFIDFVSAAPDGRLFPRKSTGAAVRKWIRNVAGTEGGLGEVPRDCRIFRA